MQAWHGAAGTNATLAPADAISTDSFCTIEICKGLGGMHVHFLLKPGFNFISHSHFTSLCL